MAQAPQNSLCCCRKSRASSAGGTPLPCLDSAPVVRPQSRKRHLVDAASASNFSCFALRHFHLDLRLNFAMKEMSAWLVLDLLPVESVTPTLVLDCHPSLLIHSVDCKVPEAAHTDATSLTYRLEPFTDYGSVLSISLPAAAVRSDRLIQITIRYTTTDGPAIWWLDSELTCGRSRPLVFTQGHSVCNRSFFPCFDTPAVKSTYTASVRVPEGLTVLMSASKSSYSRLDRVFHFSMEFPVPSYLVALVAGQLQHVDIGPRSRVWAEPCLLSCAVAKLGGAVDGWLSLAEDLFGAYLWGRCDLVFLPPSFPVVAMENPCLTFMVASILESSDFLLIDVVHEIAHSWFGNAVTNASWEQMWLSEGVATYAQRRITSCAYGEAFTCLETVLRLDALHRQLRLLGDNSPASRLQAQLQSGVNPSSLMNLFTYEKGFCLVSYLSQLCGDVRRFDRFLKVSATSVCVRGGAGAARPSHTHTRARAGVTAVCLQDYISQFKFQSVVAQDLIDYFLSCFPHLQNQGLQFDRWLNGCGAPPFQPDVSAGSTLTGPVQELCDLWRCSTSVDLQAVSRFDLSAWNSFQVVLFLDRMLDHAPYSSEVMTSLSGCYSSLFDGLSAEVLIRWLQLVVRSCFWPELPRVRAFLQKHTSRMYTVPLYEDLLASSMRTVGGEIFQQTKHRLHPNLRRALQQILPPPPET
ncbi:aminopeptidase RNPEPL1 isoform X2 [Synchiropus splendidus]|uniref:aminopeptidase RNPEPL1 isoform X2 n=1 Tax=Synchiropus splendidus TaxID=270530 RepID=UPI00237E8B77|nr:aminopeptidase RNPEPL1 isoform X2 [Synchiropus splendidus]